LRGGSGTGYCYPLTHDDPGTLCREHGYRIPFRKPTPAPET
jgi:hypothetical protein